MKCAMSCLVFLNSDYKIYPILVYRKLIVDGRKRAIHAFLNGETKIPAYILTDKIISKIWENIE